MTREREPLVGRGRTAQKGQRPQRYTEPSPFRSPSTSPDGLRRSRSGESNEGACAEEEGEGSDARPSPLLILPLNFFNAFAWSLIEVPLIYLLRTRLCEQAFGDKPGSLPYEDDKCRLESIQTQVSALRAGFQTIAAVLGLLTTASYGSISDSKGRRRVMLTSSFFSLLGELSLLTIVMLPGYTTPEYVLITAVFKGLAGYISAIVAAQNSYVADTTTTDRRARYLGWNFATYHLGTAMGPLISGVLVSRYDRMDLVYAIGTTLWGLYFLYTLFILPESNREVTSKRGEHRRSSVSSVLSRQTASRSWHWLTHVMRDHFIEPLSVVLPKRVSDADGEAHYDVTGASQESKRHWDVCLAAILVGLSLFSNGSMGMLPLYTDFKLGWGPLQASLLLSVDSFASACALTFIFPLIGWVIGSFLRRFGSAKEAWDQVTARAAWLAAEDSDQPPSGFWPFGRDHSPDRQESCEVDQTRRTTIIKRDLWVARLGYMAAALASIGIALSSNAAGLYTSVVIQALANIAVPAVQSIALNGVRTSFNGRVLAGFAVVESICLVARGPVFAAIYNASLPNSPGAVYYTSAGVYGVALLILLFIKLYRPLGDHS
ncbi:hypothetical protein PYCC9005_004996 [Savitreella phatthalungensis]